MKIAAFLPLSLCDYPGKVAAVVFTQGCNFNCPWCHNRHLIPYEAMDTKPLSEEDVLGTLSERLGRLGGVVVSGGEPTIQSDLPEFLAKLKETGIAVKLDTNGSNPDVVEHCIREKLVDFIAMDVKAPWDKYDKLTGIADSATNPIRTMEIIATSGIHHQFRTTRVEPLLTESDFASIAATIPPGSPHVWQELRACNSFKASGASGA